MYNSWPRTLFPEREEVRELEFYSSLNHKLGFTHNVRLVMYKSPSKRPTRISFKFSGSFICCLSALLSRFEEDIGTTEKQIGFINIYSTLKHSTTPLRLAT